MQSFLILCIQNVNQTGRRHARPSNDNSCCALASHTLTCTINNFPGPKLNTRFPAIFLIRYINSSSGHASTPSSGSRLSGIFSKFQRYLDLISPVSRESSFIMSSKPICMLNNLLSVSTIANANADSGGTPSSVELISGQVYA